MVQNRKIAVKQLGLIDYRTALAIQETYHATIVNQKKKNMTTKKDNIQELSSNYLLFCEHPPVYTIGRSGSMDHLLVDATTLQTQKIPLYHINRGGSVTYHGPGQLIVYPIIDLENFITDIHRYLRLLEEAAIEMLAYFNIPATRFPGLTGVWLKSTDEQQHFDSKICAIGIRVSRWVTMHGLALNVNNDLKPFSQIVPCGVSKEVTSMQKALKKPISMIAVAEMLAQTILKKLCYL